VRGAALAASLLSLAPVVACGNAADPDPLICTAIAVSSLNVIVRDAATSARICDAAVTAVLGGATFELRRSGSAEACTFAGPEERAGVFEVRVSRSGYASAVVSNVLVGADVCHVVPVQLTVDLRPSS
jgi:hypothetical protein